MADSPDLRNRRAELATMLLAAACTLALVFPVANAETKPLFQSPGCPPNCAPAIHLAQEEEQEGCYPNCLMNWYFFVNALSGLPLVFLGVMTILRHNRLALPLYLMAWGAQVAFSNTAANTPDVSPAFLMFLLSQLFLPLQAMLLLNYVERKASEDALPRIQTWAKWSAVGLGVIVLAALLLSVFFPDLVLTTTPQSNGLLKRQMKAIPTLVIQVPHFLGTTFGLVLLGWLRPKGKDALMAGSITLAWAYAVSYTLSNTYHLDKPDLILYGTFAIATAAIALLVPILLWRGLSSAWRYAVVLIPLAAVAAWFVEGRSEALRASLGPGAVRLALAIPLAIALWGAGTALSKTTRLHLVPTWVSAATTALAVLILNAHAKFHLNPEWTSTGTSLATASLILIGGMGVLQTRKWFFPPNPHKGKM
ncbi:MAG: hypothetical protein LC623_09765 [Halobacteriales archaeon]|nr:hypothetical protein [Halobacteriales archaeon]